MLFFKEVGKLFRNPIPIYMRDFISVRTILCEGGVPQRPVVFVTRPELVNEIRQKLYNLRNDPGWVTVYGMAGSGKSVLTAEALRDQSLLEGTF